ncbi:MAG: thiolase family protein [Candidatus Marinimicrobia bacterium]|nr:thiolase family protein [Candidatus Neomarinimicrobiota bacterium]
MPDFGNVVIAGPVRTPIGAFQGSISSVPATKLGATVIKESLVAVGIPIKEVDEVIMGNVMSAGLGQAPARQAALFAGLSNSTECLTVNKMCGSGLKAIMLAAQAIQLNNANVIVAGGMESMSLAPYLIPKARTGLRLGHGQLIDSVILDGLWDVYNDKHMGSCTESCVRKYQFSREQQDAFSKESYSRALKAQKDGTFEKEVVGVSITDRKGNVILVTEDDEPKRANFEKMIKLKPVFEKGGTITAANASKINDGAASVVIFSEEKAKELNVEPIAKIVAQASFSQEPEWFTTAPVGAIGKVLDKAGMSVSDIDIFEINEAFAAVTMAVMKELNLDHEVVNVHGGAVALGHPIGASGARILVTLLNAMQIRDVERGIAAICIGGGEASAVILERV